MGSIGIPDEDEPPFTVIYGVQGIGKTSFAASFPDPIIIQTENGLGMIRIPRWYPEEDSKRIPETFDEVMDGIAWLIDNKHDFQTVIIDSLDHLEPLIWAATCKDNGWENIESAGYGKGYIAALDHWRAFVKALMMLRDEKKMAVILIAHTSVTRFESPESEPYDRYGIKLNKHAGPIIQEKADLVLFNSYRVSTVKTDLGFNKKATRGVGSGDRLIHTNERPAHHAKNRYKMPDTIQLPDDPTRGFETIAPYIPFYDMQQEQV